MGKVEIKIRKKILTPDNLQQHRNYPALLKKYERTKRFRRALKIFLYSLALTIFVLALIFLSMWKVLIDKKQENQATPIIHTYDRVNYNGEIRKIIRTNVNLILTDTFYIVSYQAGISKTIIKLPAKEQYNSDLIRRLEDKIIKTNQTEFKIIKYEYDDKSSADEELFYFYSPEYGIILERSLAWGVYWRLAGTGNPKFDEIVKKLNQAIEADTEFFTGLKP
jgi:hypothetical protein